jgi:hypothetical protein
VEKEILDGINFYGVKVVFIDHLDFLTPKELKNIDQVRLIVARCMVELKMMAKQKQIVIFLLGHVRKVISGRAIEMQDISESRHTYQIADYIISVERESKEINMADSFGDPINFGEGKKVTKKMEIPFGNRAILRVLGNRRKGDPAIIKYRMEGNLMIPFGQPRYLSNLPGESFTEKEEKEIENFFTDSKSDESWTNK